MQKTADWEKSIKEAGKGPHWTVLTFLKKKKSSLHVLLIIQCKIN